jgi:hypothetical protein
MRDPRKDPQKGDVLRRYTTRKVLDVDPLQWLSILYEASTDGESLGMERVSPHAWHKWARDAEVVTGESQGSQE